MENRDKVVVLLAGGRIVRRREGMAEQVELSEEELRALLPDDLREQTAFQKWSFQPISNYTLRMCGEIVGMASDFINKDGAKAVVVTCDTQGVADFAYFADLIWDLNAPLIFTSSIFHAGSPNSETALRLAHSIRAALAGTCTGKGALLCIRSAVYSPADVIQVSNFRRTGILAFPDSPLGIFSQPTEDFIVLRSPRRRHVRTLTSPLARNIEILCAALGGGDLMLKALLDKRVEELDGLVVAGMGDGDVPSSWLPLLRKLHRGGLPIVLAAPPGCRVQAVEDFEGSAAQLLEMGLLSAGMLSPAQARIRLAVGLASGLSGGELAQYMRGE